MNSARILFFDGLRGILAFIVFLHHFLYIFCPTVIFGGEYSDLIESNGWSLTKLVALTPINILFNPGAAIIFFFIISGYIQSFQYLKSGDITVLQKSIFKRYFRLALPSLAVLILIYIFHKCHFYSFEYLPQNVATANWSKSMLPDQLGFWEVIKFGLYDEFFSNSKYYQVLWTMPVELNNSLMVLIVLLVSHAVSNKKTVFVLWLLILIIFFHNYYSVAFVIGSAFCYFENYNFEVANKTPAKALRIISLLLGIYLASYPNFGYKNVARIVYYPISFFEYVPVVFAYIIGNSLILFYILFSEKTKGVLSSPVLLFAGKISFMFYLLHFLILFSFSPWLYHQFLGSVSLNTNLLLTCLISFLLISIVSFAFYKAIDKPAIKICNRLSNNIFK